MVDLKKIIGRWKNRRETPDPTPVAQAVNFRHPPTLQEQIARHMHIADLYARQNGLETFEEAEDFDVGDDIDPSVPMDQDTPHELVYDADLGKEIHRPEKQFLDEQRADFDKFAAAKKSSKKSPKPPAEE